MNNQELELKIKEIIEMPNMFDMIIAAKDFEKDYKTSDFYKATKISLMEIIKDAKVTDLSKLSTSTKNELKALVNNVGANTKVPVSINNGKLFVGYVNEPEKAFYNDKVNVKTDVKYTDGNLVITIASVVAIIGIATIAVKAKKQNA